MWQVWADGAPFDHHVMTFNTEGTMLQSNPDAGNEHYSTSIGMGVWRAEGDLVVGRFLETRAHRVTRIALGCSIIRFTLRITLDEFTGHAVATNHDRHGATLGGSAAVTLRGTRFAE